MIDRHALKEVAAKHFDGMASPSGVSLVLYLLNGETYTVSNFAEFLDTYCVVRVYPAQALSAESVRKVVPQDHEGRLIFDRLMLPYSVIAYVTLTAQEPERKSTMGFSE